MELFELTEEIEGLLYNQTRNQQWDTATALIGTILANADRLDYKKLLYACMNEHQEILNELNSNQ